MSYDVLYGFPILPLSLGEIILEGFGLLDFWNFGSSEFWTFDLF